jgi:hypothetical protein
MKTTKSIQLNEKLHIQLKEYCNSKGLKLQSFVEKLIEYELRENLRSNNQESSFGKSKEI